MPSSQDIPPPAATSRSWPVPRRLGAWRRCRAWKNRLPSLVLLLAALAALGFCTALAWAATHDAQRAKEAVERQNLQLLRAFRLHTQAALELVDFVLLRASEEWLTDGEIRSQRAWASDMPNFKGLILQVAIISPDGMLAASSLGRDGTPLYLGDRPHFQAHQADRHDPLFIGQPLVGRLSGRPSIQVSRALRDPQGSLLAVAVVSMDPDFLHQFLRQMQVDASVQLGLLGQDGRLRAWVGSGLGSGDKNWLDQNSAGLAQLVATGMLDVTPAPSGQPQHWNFEQAGAFPLGVIVGQNLFEALADVRQRRDAALGLAALFVLVTGLVSAHLVASVRTQGRLLQNLRASEASARAASQLKSRFLANVSHDLRTPLNGILGFSELVAQAPDAPTLSRYGQMIHRSATQLHSLVNTMLDLAQIEAGRMRLERSWFNVLDVCLAVTDLHRLNAENKGLQWLVQHDADLPTKLYSDKLRLTQVLGNVLHNAVKFTERGSIHCTVSHRAGHWHFWVRDTGPGMSPEQQAEIFERFRGSSASSVDEPVQRGSGLGLALCKELMDLLGGRIALHSTPGQGTQVELVLPDGSPA